MDSCHGANHWSMTCAPSNQASTITVIIMLACVAISDIGIAAALCVLLWRRRTGFARYVVLRIWFWKLDSSTLRKAMGG